MNLSILQNAGSVDPHPYPHLVIENCLPADLYDELDDTRPSDDYLVDGRSFGSNIRLDLHARQLIQRRDLPVVWLDFIKYHLSKKFWQEIIRVFGENLVDMNKFAKLVPEVTGGRLLSQMPVMMRTDKSRREQAISMDVNVGVNTPVVGPASRVRGPHVDNPIELFAAMLYMPHKDDLLAAEEGGDFVIYAKSIQVRFEGKAEVHHHDEATLSEYARVKYKRNTMVCFINSLNAIHGVTPRQSHQFRRLVNFCAELPFATFTIPR